MYWRFEEPASEEANCMEPQGSKSKREMEAVKSRCLGETQSDTENRRPCGKSRTLFCFS